MPEFDTSDRDATGWSANAYQSAAHFVYSATNTAPVLQLLNAQPGERIVDFGCGSGEITRQIMDAVGVTGEVAAIDISSSMIAKAKLAMSLPETHLLVGDLQSATLLEDTRFPEHLIGKTDKVFTSATLHWCKSSPRTAAENAFKILKPGGMVAGEFGGHGNVAVFRAAIHAALETRGIDAHARDPWYFPTPEEYTAVLKAAGFKPHTVTLLPRTTPVHSLVDWIRTFAGHNLLGGLDSGVEQAIVDEVVAACKEKYAQDKQERWGMDYVRLRFVAIKEAV